MLLFESQLKTIHKTRHESQTFWNVLQLPVPISCCCWCCSSTTKNYCLYETSACCQRRCFCCQRREQLSACFCSCTVVSQRRRHSIRTACNLLAAAVLEVHTNFLLAGFAVCFAASVKSSCYTACSVCCYNLASDKLCLTAKPCCTPEMNTPQGC